MSFTRPKSHKDAKILNIFTHSTSLFHSHFHFLVVTRLPNKSYYLHLIIPLKDFMIISWSGCTLSFLPHKRLLGQTNYRNLYCVGSHLLPFPGFFILPSLSLHSKLYSYWCEAWGKGRWKR